jgi:hypothetical protein
MEILGDVISCGIVRGQSSRRHPLDNCEEPIPNPAYDGWNVHFRYAPCPSCGESHAQNASNVWPTGDSAVHLLKAKCPTSNESIDIELIKPGLSPSPEDLLNRELRRLRQQERDAEDEPVKPSWIWCAAKQPQKSSERPRDALGEVRWM